MPLWSGRFTKDPADDATRLGRSIDFDVRLWRQDLMATSAHAAALQAAGILTPDELTQIDGAIEEASRWFESGESGTLSIDPSDEDIHSVVERFLSSKLGALGAKIHAGRSRNDLVATDLKLWLKEATVEVCSLIVDLQDCLLQRAEEHRSTICPGYTHLQRAQPTVLAHVLLAHAFALGRDFERMKGAHARCDSSSLGAAAFAGSSIPIDAEQIASTLGFTSLFDNSIDAVSARDFALEFLSAGAILAVQLSRMGEDLVLWTSSEFSFARIDDAYATGSSIMPQKRNPDVAELTRARSARTTANLVHLLGVMKGLPLSYNRDMQEDKEPVFDTFDSLVLTLRAMTGLYRTLEFDVAALASAASGGHSGATTIAEALVMKGIPFREAHEMVGKLVLEAESRGCDVCDLPAEALGTVHAALDPSMLEAARPIGSIAARRSHGGPSPVEIDSQLSRLAQLITNARRWKGDA